MNAQDRLPLTIDAPDLAGLAGDIERLETIFESWEQTPRGVAEAYRRAIEALHAEALRRMIRALKSAPEAMKALKGAAGDEVVYAVLRRHDIIKASIDERVEAALDSVRPMLASHGGDVELVRIAPPNLEVRYTGLNFSDSERVSFRYRLEGYDKDWVAMKQTRTSLMPPLAIIFFSISPVVRVVMQRGSY